MCYVCLVYGFKKNCIYLFFWDHYFPWRVREDGPGAYPSIQAKAGCNPGRLFLGGTFVNLTKKDTFHIKQQ